MAQILINIPDFLYKQILKKHVSKATIARVFQNGVVLPKGHGRLVDADEVGKYVIIGNAARTWLHSAKESIEELLEEEQEGQE